MFQMQGQGKSSLWGCEFPVPGQLWTRDSRREPLALATQCAREWIWQLPPRTRRVRRGGACRAGRQGSWRPHFPALSQRHPRHRGEPLGALSSGFTPPPAQPETVGSVQRKLFREKLFLGNPKWEAFIFKMRSWKFVLLLKRCHK